ncbi:MAG: hypothetical protein BWZ07_02851 [Alphaproteobacteria bacterium ADurb.BinA280]|nr:MAG: hypothetical protein BWZ07_02851 [Alphaproteobacteria bacterium ADurb.BinA280]
MLGDASGMLHGIAQAVRHRHPFELGIGEGDQFLRKVKHRERIASLLAATGAMVGDVEIVVLIHLVHKFLGTNKTQGYVR